jgi:hypothetical protein
MRAPIDWAPESAVVGGILGNSWDASPSVGDGACTVCGEPDAAGRWHDCEGDPYEPPSGPPAGWADPGYRGR